MEREVGPPPPPLGGFSGEDCEKIVIDSVNHVQNWGALVALDPHGTIQVISENANTYFNAAWSNLLNRPIEAILEPQEAATLRQIITRDDLSIIHTLKMRLLAEHTGQEHTVKLHKNTDNMILMEFEPSLGLVDQVDLVQRAYAAVLTLREPRDLAALCQSAVTAVQQITGYDRVLAYQFDGEGHGLVVAEARRENIASLLGLRYPASDIPPRARELFRANQLRMITNVWAQPVMLRAPTPPAATLDLTHVALRGVANGHLIYLKHMGVSATFTIAIVKNGTLWGLLACHHLTPRYMHFEIRALCKLLGVVFSEQISLLEQVETSRQVAALKSGLITLLEQLAQHPRLPKAIEAQLAAVMNLFKATGLIMKSGEDVAIHGETPALPMVPPLLEWLATQPPVWETDRLPALWTPGGEWAAVASGCIVIRLQPDYPLMLVWLRPEQVQRACWGRDIHQPFADIGENDPLNPAHSFQQWQEVVHGRSVAWTATELETIVELRQGLRQIASRQVVNWGSPSLPAPPDHAQTMIFILRDGTVDYLNSAAHLITGYDHEYLMLQGFWELFFPDHVLPLHPIEKPIQTRSGAWRWMAVVLCDITLDGQPAILGTAHDITRLKESESRLAVAQSEREHMQALADFVREVSHDLRNPMATIRTDLFVMKMTQDVEKRASLIEVVERQLDYMHHVINDLTMIAQLDGRANLNLTGVDVNQLVSSVGLRLHSTAAEKLQTLEVRLTPDLPPVLGSYTDLERCLSNLIENAMRYTPANGKITVHTSTRERYNVIEVSDTGPGIPPEEIPLIFQRFYRGNKSRGTKGTGLGLAIVARIVELHQGRITVESEVGRGSRFFIWLNHADKWTITIVVCTWGTRKG